MHLSLSADVLVLVVSVKEVTYYFIKVYCYIRYRHVPLGSAAKTLNISAYLVYNIFILSIKAYLSV